MFAEASGSPLVISDDLFKTRDGNWKADKDGRGPDMRLLAQAVKAPDEIWLKGEAKRDATDTWLLKRRFIKSWQIDDQDGPQYGLSVFEYGQDGWISSTFMMSNADRGVDARRRYIEKQRDGFLLYRK